MNKLLPLSLLALAAACRPVGPDYVPPRPPLPDHFDAPTGGAEAQPRWWTALGDPVLDALLEEARADSPDLAIAEARWRQARALQGVRDAQAGPSLGLDAKVSRDHLSRNGEMLANLPLPSPRLDFDNYQAGFDASWELDVFGHTRRVREGARARAEAALERVQDARTILAAETARAYLDYRAAQARLRLSEASLADLEDLERLASLSRRAGETSQADLDQTRGTLAAFRGALEGQRAALRQDLAALAVLTGKDPGALASRLGDGGPLPAVPPIPAGGVPSDLLRKRPDLRAAERDLAAASADVGTAVAERYPRFTLVGTAGWNAVHSGSLIQNASRTWSLGPQLSLPLFNGGQLKRQEQAQRAALDAALATYHKAVLAALADTDLAFTRMARSEAARAQTEEARDRQASILALTERQVKAGETSRMAQLQARRALLAQEDLAVQNRAQSLTALVAVMKALGGAW